MSSRKQQILESAISVIARRGVRGLRVEEVAAEAEVAVSLIYYHFKNREGLIRATLDRANEIADENLSRSVGHDGDGFGQALEILEAELDEAEPVREVSTVWGEVLASAIFDPGFRDQIRTANAKWTDLVAEVIRRGQGDGSIPSELDPVACAESLTVFVDGLSSRWLAGLVSHEQALELLHLVAGSLLRGTVRPAPG